MTNATKPFNKNGKATFQIDSLSALDQFTICARFRAYQFNDMYYYTQSVISLHSNILFGSFTTGDKCTFKDCATYWKNYFGEIWKYGKAFSFTHSYGYFSLMDELRPRKWYSLCINIDVLNESIDYLINQNNIHNRRISRELIGNGSIFLLNSNEQNNPFYGEITDVNIWNRVLNSQDIAEWTYCRESFKGNVMNWDDISKIQFVHLELKNIDMKDICNSSSAKDVNVYKNSVETAQDTIKFCNTIGATVAIAKTADDLKNMYSLYESIILEANHSDFWFFTGYIKEDNMWMDIVDKSLMVWRSFDEGYPMNIRGQDCIVSNNSRTMISDSCYKQFYPICESVDPLKIFTLDGVCEGSGVDTNFVFINSTYLLGYMNTEITFNEDKLWRIRSVRNGTTLATLNTDTFPIGQNQWLFEQNICRDRNETFRTMNLHLDVPQPGAFCCEDGMCIPSEFVCDNIPQCNNKEDEKGCQMILSDTKSDMPPITVQSLDKYKNTEVQASFTVMDVLDVNEQESMFDIYFMLELSWIDHNVNYAFLKKDTSHNFFEGNVTWVPKIQFYLIRSQHHFDFGTKYFVKRNESSKPILSGVREDLNRREIYLGRDHTLKMVMKMRSQFICSFDKIANYPFGEQECYMGFYIEGHSNQMTDLLPSNFSGSKGIFSGEYFIKNWKFSRKYETESGEWSLRVTMVLSRQFFGIFMVTFFPTILMNIINQASTFITGDSRYTIIS